MPKDPMNNLLIHENPRVLFRYRKNKNPERTARAKTYPASVLAQNANMFHTFLELYSDID
uniref:Uncharacterized protein n=1 Tax=Candidatus Kentrum sp. LFY TaxID=2126342 RepID=A0A450WVK7_9GAMM|nr:MAG: hypothetical protein BECKLFY1418C_GA0070996_10842 [Candidatus Kentron sp. LFY]